MMKPKQMIVVGLALMALLALLLPVGAAAAGGTISWLVIGGGGGHAESGIYSLDSTIGQPVVGLGNNAPYDLCVGFWCGAIDLRIFLPLILR
jgi:hypothetical protein